MKKIIAFLIFGILCCQALAITWTVTSSGNNFSPATLTISVGDNVNFNIASIHDVLEVSQTTWNSNGTTPLPGGFSTPNGGGMISASSLGIGTHYYVCTPHASQGMKGRIIVQACSAPTQPGAITGNTTVCPSTNNNYSVAAVNGATSYTWTLPDGWAGSSTTNTITTNAGSGGGTISVTANNSCSSSPPRTLSVGIGAAPAMPGAISGNTTVCTGTTNTFSVAAVPGATSYTWTLPSGWTGNSTTNSINATTAAANGTISVTANNACNSSEPRTLSVGVNSLPAVAGNITGNTSMCSGTTNTYSIDPVSGATSYSWTLPSGWTGSSTTNSITTVAGTSSGNIGVSAVNNCGASGFKTLGVTVGSSQSIPGSISGNTVVCPNSSNIYSISAVSGATNYTWTLPSGWTGSSTTNSITVTSNSNSGTISVVANGSCGTSPPKTQDITVSSTLPAPGTLTGNLAPCFNTTIVYSVPPVAGANSYVWTLPAGWIGSSTGNSISATVGASGGNITVSANNSCGTSSTKIQPVTVNSIPATPSTINGNTAVCQGSSNTYTTDAVANSGSYTWVLPPGWTGNSSSNSITAIASSNGGNISVTATNVCGSSGTKTLAVTISSLPPTPEAIIGTPMVCSGSSTTYSTNAVAGASSYTWSLPSGWSGNSTTNTITVLAGENNGNIGVKVNTACGTSLEKTLSLTINKVNTTVSLSGNTLRAEATAATYQWINCSNGSPVAGQTNQTFTSTTGGNYAVIIGQNGCIDTSSCFSFNTVASRDEAHNQLMTVYPNPSQGKIFLQFKGVVPQLNAIVEIYNLQGRVISQFKVNNPLREIDLQGLAGGIYYLKYSSSQVSYVKKIIIEK